MVYAATRAMYAHVCSIVMRGKCVLTLTGTECGGSIGVDRSEDYHFRFNKLETFTYVHTFACNFTAFVYGHANAYASVRYTYWHLRAIMCESIHMCWTRASITMTLLRSSHVCTTQFKVAGNKLARERRAYIVRMHREIIIKLD